MKVKYITEEKKHFLNPSETYEVEYETEDRYAIKSNTSSEICTFRKKHFIEVNEDFKMKVKCINTGSWTFITKSKVYNVIEATSTEYIIYDDYGIRRSYNKNCFEEVKEDNNMDKIMESINKRFEELNVLIEQLKVKHKELEKEVNAKAWKPKKEEKYWFITAVNDVEHDSNNGSSIDERIIKVHNAFKTKEEAERKAFERQLFGDLEEFALENNDKEIDWASANSIKNIITFNNKEGIKTIYVSYLQNMGAIYFTSKKVAEKAIEKYEEELTRYFTTRK